MKFRLLLPLFLLTASIACAQKPEAALPVSAETHLVDYTKVVEVAGATKSELFARAKVWLAKSTTSAKSAIEAEDKDAGVLVAKGYQIVDGFGGLDAPAKLWYTVKITVKDGKYRYNLTDFKYDWSTIPYQYASKQMQPEPVEGLAFATRRNGTLTSPALRYSNYLDKTAHATIASLESGMTVAATGTDW